MPIFPQKYERSQMMQLTNLNSSTGMQEGFSDGAYKKNSIMPWSQNQSYNLETKGVQDHVFNWVRFDTGTQITMFTRFSADNPKHSDILRHAFHQVIEVLPDSSLDELGTILGELLEFYQEDMNSTLQNNMLPTLSTRPALKGSTYERTTFHIDED